jgi:hypothetical protein
MGVMKTHERFAGHMTEALYGQFCDKLLKCVDDLPCIKGISDILRYELKEKIATKIWGRSGLALLPASIIAGLLWDHVSQAAAFYYGSITATISATLFIIFIIFDRRRNQIARNDKYSSGTNIRLN